MSRPTGERISGKLVMPEAKTPPKIKQTATKNSTEFAEWWATGDLTKCNAGRVLGVKNCISRN